MWIMVGTFGLIKHLQTLYDDHTVDVTKPSFEFTYSKAYQLKEILEKPFSHAIHVIE